jgi:hypothetical protein
MESPHAYALFKADRTFNPFIVTRPDLGDDKPSGRIRCPHCAWRPSRHDLWSCGGGSGPEPYKGCGTTWNTFSTRGVCPGCSHRWRWTLCPECSSWSRHDDWYEDATRAPEQ